MIPAAEPRVIDFGTAIPTAIAHWLRRCWDTERLLTGIGEIELAFAEDAPDTPRRGIAVTTMLDGASLTWIETAARRWRTSHDGAGVELSLEDARARILAWAPPPLDAPRSVSWLSLALHVALSEAQRSRGLVPLHAAIIVRDGLATALLGRSGVGKSTALLDAVDAGWSPLAEDFAWLDPTTKRVCAWKGDRGVRLSDDGVKRLSPHWQSRAWRREPDGKLLLDYDDMPAPRTRLAELTRVVVLQRGDIHRSSQQPLARRDATRALWESAGVPLCRINRDAFAARTPSLVCGLEWQRLVVGRGPSSL